MEECVSGEVIAGGCDGFMYEECDYYGEDPDGVSAPPGQIITLEIEDFEMEPEKDFVLIRDGEEPDSPQLRTLTGKMEENPQFVVSTGNR